MMGLIAEPRYSIISAKFTSGGGEKIIIIRERVEIPKKTKMGIFKADLKCNFLTEKNKPRMVIANKI